LTRTLSKRGHSRATGRRPDWETVVRAVVDFALTLPGVNRSRIALAGWSFGGYLAPRAASGEPRLAALIADPGQWDLIEQMAAATAAKEAHPAPGNPARCSRRQVSRAGLTACR
jgi:dienelactone hydrolase